VVAAAVFLAVVGLGWTLGRVADDDPAQAEPTAGDATPPSGDVGLPPLLTGSILITGADQLDGLSVAVATKYLEAQPLVVAELSGPGLDLGLGPFCDGQQGIDIGQSDRPITAEEANACALNGIGYVELAVAVDAVTGDELYLYVSNAASEVTQDFVTFYLNHGLADTVTEVGQIPLDEATLALTLTTWQAAFPES
jgi:ABC-type phosphate transport system substrate-binding protein